MNGFEEIYYNAKGDIWFTRFAIFCRIALALSFIPTGFVKIMGERFAEGLPPNNPLGHYFDALHTTGYYYTFIGVMQLLIAVLLLIPRTAFLGALMYFPVIVNITVLTYATRFDGTRLVTMMLMASIFLLVWYYERLKFIVLFSQPTLAPHVESIQRNTRLRLIFFGGCIAILVIIIFGTFYLWELVPGNSEEVCRNQCDSNKNPEACQAFCDCIYQQGKTLETCLDDFNGNQVIK